MQKLSLKDKHKNELKQLQREIVSKAKLKSTDGNDLKEGESIAFFDYRYFSLSWNPTEKKGVYNKLFTSDNP